MRIKITPESLKISNKIFNVYKYKSGKRVRTKISISKELYDETYRQQLCGYGCEDFVKIIQEFIDEYKIEKNVSQTVTAFLIKRFSDELYERYMEEIRKSTSRDYILQTYFVNTKNIPRSTDRDALMPFMNKEYWNLTFMERDKHPKKG